MLTSCTILRNGIISYAQSCTFVNILLIVV